VTLWRTKRAWIETGGVLRRTTAFGASRPLSLGAGNGSSCPGCGCSVQQKSEFLERWKVVML
jgi:hypothetical protein